MIDYVRSFLLKHLSISRLTSRRSLCLPVAKSIAIASSFQRSNEPLRVVAFPVPEIRSALTDLLERMSVLVESLDREAQRRSDSEKRAKKHNQRTTVPPSPVTYELKPDEGFLEWLVNKPQVDRIIEHLDMLEGYVEQRKALRNPIDRFISLVNGFLVESDKPISVDSTGQLKVTIKGEGKPRAINALSSGERQIVVMLAHLSLNPSLSESGVIYCG